MTQDLEALRARMEAAEGAVFYFSTSECNVCKVLRPKVEALLAAEFPKMTFEYVDLGLAPEVSGQLGIFAVPTVVVIFGGRETHRFGRHLGLEALREALARPYGLVFG